MVGIRASRVWFSKCRQKLCNSEGFALEHLALYYDIQFIIVDRYGDIGYIRLQKPVCLADMRIDEDGHAHEDGRADGDFQQIVEAMDIAELYKYMSYALVEQASDLSHSRNPSFNPCPQYIIVKK